MAQVRPEAAIWPIKTQLFRDPPILESLLLGLLTRTSRYSYLSHILLRRWVELHADLSDPAVGPSSQQVLQLLIHSLTVIMWAQMMLDWYLTLLSKVVVQTWRGSGHNSLGAIHSKDYKTLFGSSAHWFLDCGHDYLVDPKLSNPESPIKPPYVDYCSQYKNWRHMYAFDPLGSIHQSQRYLIFGGGIHLWHLGLIPSTSTACYSQDHRLHRGDVE